MLLVQSQCLINKTIEISIGNYIGVRLTTHTNVWKTRVYKSGCTRGFSTSLSCKLLLPGRFVGLPRGSYWKKLQSTTKQHDVEHLAFWVHLDRQILNDVERHKNIFATSLIFGQCHRKLVDLTLPILWFCDSK